MLQARLKVIGGKHDGQVIPLKAQKFLIGRESDCHLRTNSELISRHHCVFSLDSYAVRLRDLGSTNGTFVNGERVNGQVVLSAGDRVKIGRLEFELEVPSAVPAGETAANGPQFLPAAPQESGEDEGADTAYELPVETTGAETDTVIAQSSDDTAVISPVPGQPYDPASQQPAYYPPYYQQFPQPGYYPPPPGYYPQYGAPYPQPPGGYPPQAPGYYPPQQYPPPEQPQGGDARNRGVNVPSPPVKLPTPESTGASSAPQAPPKPAEPKADAGKTPSERAAEILKDRMKRRLQGS